MEYMQNNLHLITGTFKKLTLILGDVFHEIKVPRRVWRLQENFSEHGSNDERHN